MTHYKSKLNEVLEHNNFPINSRVKYIIDRRDFEDSFDMYVKEINFDLSPHYKRYFKVNVLWKITEYTNDIDRFTNGVTIEDLERLTKVERVVFKTYLPDYIGDGFEYVLLRVFPKTVKWKYDDRYFRQKKDDFINNMIYREFAIETDEGEFIIINKSNINEYI